MGKHASPGSRLLPLGLVIIHEDRDILVVDKPAGLLTIATDRDKERTAYFILTDYVRKGSVKSRHRIFIVHRLDRETSGILILAKTEEAKIRLQSQWDGTAKKYLAVVHGKLAKSADTITSYLVENEKSLIVYSTTDAVHGKLSHTAYKVLRETKSMSLLEVEPLTGRKNQIRVHLAAIGHPIVGDKKYGKGDGIHKRLALHARSITFKHPFSGQLMTLSTKVPGYFTTLVGGVPGEERPPDASTPSR